jgi:hypothetical protein
VAVQFDDEMLKFFKKDGKAINMRNLANFLELKLDDQGYDLALDSDNEEKINKFALKLIDRVRKSKNGRILLNYISKMKICDFIDDTLFFHTNPTDAMIKLFMQDVANKDGTIANNVTIMERVNILNMHFQRGLKERLNGTAEPYDETMYNYLFYTFLKTDNRQYGESHLEELKKRFGINRIIHGHTRGDGGFYKNCVEIRSIDGHIARIDVNGKLNIS